MFPHLDHIDQILPAVEDRKEFIVADKGSYKVVNYNLELPDTFDIDVTDTLKDASGIRFPVGAFRRECRGLIFDQSGKLISRPFHKFFNIGQRAETMPNKLDFRLPHFRFEKMDGSMIRPFFVDGKLRLGTKMGVTDTAEQAEEWLQDHPNCNDIADFMEMSMVHFNQTLLFEWVSPENNIVVRYDEPRLVFLAARDNFTGEYRHNIEVPFIESAPSFDSIEDFDAYLEATKDDTDREGDIFFWPDLGLKVKSKNEWYVTIHRAKDDIGNDRKLLKAILNSEIDDIIPKLDAATVDRVKEFEIEFWKQFDMKVRALVELNRVREEEWGNNRKEVALNIIPNLTHKKDAQFVFGGMDGKDINEMALNFAVQSCGSGRNYEAMREWLLA